MLLACLYIENHWLVPVTFGRKECVLRKHYEKGGVKSEGVGQRCQSYGETGTVGQGGVKTGHKAFKTQT